MRADGCQVQDGVTHFRHVIGASQPNADLMFSRALKLHLSKMKGYSTILCLAAFCATAAGSYGSGTGSAEPKTNRSPELLLSVSGGATLSNDTFK